MSYTNKIKIEIPSGIYEIACSIARALDPDVGGEYSFGSKLQGELQEQPKSYSTETPCTAGFAEQVTALMQDPVVLHAVVQQDYASRWGELQAPTLEDCKLFCKLAVVTDVTDTSNSLVTQESILKGDIQ